MKDMDKTKEQLIQELEGLRRRIAELENSEEDLKQSEERYRLLVENQTDLVSRFTPDGTFIFVNDAYCHFFGKTKDELVGKKWHPLPVDEDVSSIYEKLQTISPSNKNVLIENRVFSGKENIHWMQFLNKGYFDPQGVLVAIQSVGRDITERKQAEESLKTLSLKDDLTGLYNRRGFFALAEQGLKTAQRMGTEMVLIFGDLDNMKRINDTLGHKEGDQALVDVSQILRETFRESDIIARIGGDEFVILAMNSFETSAEKLVNRFEQGLNDHPLQGERPYTISLSLGIACFDPQNPCSVDVLLTEADKMMYENKQKKSIQGLN